MMSVFIPYAFCTAKVLFTNFAKVELVKLVTYHCGGGGTKMPITKSFNCAVLYG